MKTLLDTYLSNGQINAIKQERCNRINKLILLLEEKDINFFLDKKIFFENESYLSYALISYAYIVDRIKDFTNDKIGFKELKEDVENLSDKLNTVKQRDNLILIDYQAKDFIDNLFLDALKIIRKTPFKEYEKFIGCIAILEHVKSEDVIHNYTEDFHINTIFTDYVINDRVQNAEIVIHETAHIYFNYFLESNKIDLDISKLYLDAPWKSEIKRHERGFLHGVFAFSNVLAFYKEIDKKDFNFSKEEKNFIKSYINFRELQVRKVKKDALEIIKKYPNELQYLILEILNK